MLNHDLIRVEFVVRFNTFTKISIRFLLGNLLNQPHVADAVDRRDRHTDGHPNII